MVNKVKAYKEQEQVTPAVPTLERDTRPKVPSITKEVKPAMPRITTTPKGDTAKHNPTKISQVQAGSKIAHLPLAGSSRGRPRRPAESWKKSNRASSSQDWRFEGLLPPRPPPPETSDWFLKPKGTAPAKGAQQKQGLEECMGIIHTLEHGSVHKDRLPQIGKGKSTANITTQEPRTDESQLGKVVRPDPLPIPTSPARALPLPTYTHQSPAKT